MDDIFIGLDIANRLPLLTILENEFPSTRSLSPPTTNPDSSMNAAFWSRRRTGKHWNFRVRSQTT